MSDLQAILEQIRIIDARSDGVCREVFRRTRVNIFDSGSWQLAWDRYPDLYERRQQLSRQRWPLMETRDAILTKEARAAERRQQAEYRKAAAAAAAARCPTCGSHTLAA